MGISEEPPKMAETAEKEGKSGMGVESELSSPVPPSVETKTAMTSPAPIPSQPLKLTPLTSLELRIRQLEFLVSGAVSSDARGDGSKDVAAESTNIIRRVLEVQNELERAVEGKSSLERFLDTCECILQSCQRHFQVWREV